MELKNYKSLNPLINCRTLLAGSIIKEFVDCNDGRLSVVVISMLKPSSSTNGVKINTDCLDSFTAA